MPISVTCRNCDESYTVRDENAGRTFKCKSCGESVTVPKRGTGSRSGGSAAGGSRSESGSQPAPPRRKKPTRKRARRPVEDDYDSYEDDYDDDSYEDYDEGPSRGGGRGRSGRPSGRSSRRSRSGGKQVLRNGLLVVAVSSCVYAAGFSLDLFQTLLRYLGGASLNTFAFLHATEDWLRFLALAGMLGGYGFCLAGPQRENSRTLNIAALVMGVISFGIVLFLEIVPRFDHSFETTRRNLRLLSGYFPGGDLWGTVFKQLLLEALHLAHFVLFLLAMRCQVSRSRSLESSCGVVLFPIGAYGGATVLKLLYAIFYYRVIVANAMKNREQALALWRWILQGLGWLPLIAFTVFLVLYLRVLFLSRSDV